ncbi:MAG TPA: Gfo/Idh/MocA family oxidoreductase [candidate division Zixibacteria bacterium]|nr:Gfo/Idh/MocA family oxidoreductase [candidate division Zixibacteria bacterium]
MNIGIIGCGYWGPNLVRNFNALEDARVVGVSDLRPERLEYISRLYPHIKIISRDCNDILHNSGIDAVVIATPVSTHFTLGMEALENGKHILMEKPMTATTEQAEVLIETAERKNLTLMVDHTFIYTGAVRKIKELVASGELGDLYYFDSVRVNLGLFQSDVNVIWDLAPHDVSIMDHLLDQPPRMISAMGVAHFGGGIENMAYISVLYDSGLIGHVHVNWLAPVKVRKTLICGSKKMIVYDDVEPSEKVKVYNKGVDYIKKREEAYDILIQYRTGDMLAPRLELIEALNLVAGEFYDSVNDGRRPLTDGAAGLRVVKILEAANNSLKQGGKVIKL